MSFEAEQIGITNVQLCPPKDFKYILKGSYSVKEATFLEFQVDYCNEEYLKWKYPD